MLFRLSIAFLFLTLCFSKIALAQSTAPSFGKDVWPLLKRACLECHGPIKQAGDLRVDSLDSLIASGAIDRSSPDKSELLRRIALPRGHEEIMPARGEPLAESQVELLKRWIAAGANWSAEDIDARHWAYVPPQRATLPDVSQPDWIRTPVDNFVMARLDKEGLKPSPRATPEKLIRRLYLDLIGLPPNVDQVQSFVKDPSDARLNAVVDELLKRPQFGERWARPWLDLARYADSHGFQRDNLREMWAYRDWVIQAINADMPFDQFSIEQIAGDLLPNATQSQRVATGFHRCTPSNVEAGSLPEETRIEQVIDRVNTTGAVWLGTTLECCQCHDHKYDPFTQKEYYQLLAYFNNTQLEANLTNPKTPSSIDFQGVQLPLADAERDVKRDELKKELSGLQTKLDAKKQELEKQLPKWAEQTAKAVKDASQLHLLPVTDFSSEGSTDTSMKLPDGSILLKGDDPPDTDVYVAKVSAAIENIKAFRIDVLRDDSLPGKGPGRGDAQRRNFVLNEFTVELPEGENKFAEFSEVKASFSQKNLRPEMAIDKVDRTGWAISPEFNQDHWITFVLKQPLTITKEQTLVFTMRQLYGQARTIGRFRLSAVTGNLNVESVSGEIAQAVGKRSDQWTDKEKELLLKQSMSTNKAVQGLERQIAKLNTELKRLQPDTTEVMVELPMARETHMFERGDYRKPGKLVQATTPATLHSAIDGPQDRLALARWLVSKENPLVARVTVNRWWSELFGQGLVATPEDFGAKGDLPSHPELLDWLACEFMDEGWSMKAVLKTIVLSSTYQQSSNMTDHLRTIDPSNVLLARGPNMRMDAEMIRDNALAISGLLNLKQFGPPIRPYQPAGIWSKVGGTAYTYEVSENGEEHRRGIYVILKRGTPYPSFINFDANARQACTTKRSRTNTPLQALTLLNDPVFVETAEGLARRVISEGIDRSVDERIDYMFQLCTARIPTEREHRALRDLYDAQTPSSEKPAVEKELATWKSLATVALNLHETITKD